MSDKRPPKLPDISRITPPVCPYCGKPSRFCRASVVYGTGRDYFGFLWVCVDYPTCDAYVGCHRGSGVPLGRLANKELRRAKNDAHRSFDRLWEAVMRRDGVSKGSARGRAYQWLAARMGIDPKDCHVGMFNVEQCKQVKRICDPYRQRADQIIFEDSP